MTAGLPTGVYLPVNLRWRPPPSMRNEVMAVTSLVTGVEKIPARIDIAVTRIISPRPFFADQLRRASPVDGEDGDGVVEPVEQRRRTLPSCETITSEVKFVPANVGGSVETSSSGCNVPLLAS